MKSFSKTGFLSLGLFSGALIGIFAAILGFRSSPSLQSRLLNLNPPSQLVSEAWHDPFAWPDPFSIFSDSLGGRQMHLKSSFNRRFPLPPDVDADKLEMKPEGDRIVLKFPKSQTLNI